jgi:hypothetical protein
MFSVAKGPKFRPQNTKKRKIVWGRENLGPNFCQIYQKRTEKRPNFFVVWFCSKIVIFLAENCNVPLIYIDIYGPTSQDTKPRV